MTLPIAPPFAPMLAKLAREIPAGEGLSYEPKWDGFRCIVFRDTDEIVLGSRNGNPLNRYFPELIASLDANLPDRCVLDGEIVIAGPAGLDFDALEQRIHPAASRVKHLSEITPASFVAFDLLALDDRNLLETPYRRRRELLEASLAEAHDPVFLTPVTPRLDVAHDWFSRFEGAGLDGLVVKSDDSPYEPGKRTMIKVKHGRTADCAVGGFRWHKEGGTVGSLLLGLYDQQGTLHHVGVASGFSAATRKDLVEQLSAYRTDSEAHHPWLAGAEITGRVPGGQSRWSAGKNLDWEPLRLGLVVEVAYDHLQGDRFRHATSLVRWRNDRDPGSCTYDQLEAPVPAEIAHIFD